MILPVIFSSLPDMSQTSAGSFLSLLLYFPFSLPLLSSSSVRAVLRSNFVTSVHHGTSFEGFRATPALRHWLTYHARFSYCVFSVAVCAVLCRPLCCARVCTHPLPSGKLLAGTPIIFSLTITAQSKLCNQNHYTPKII